MTHRQPADLDVSSREQSAVQALGERRSRVKARVLFVTSVLAVGAGLVGYTMSIDWQLDLMGVAYLWINMAVGFGLPTATIMFIGSKVARWQVARCIPTWVDQLAKAHDVPRDRLEAVARAVQSL